MTNRYDRAARRSKWILILLSHIINSAQAYLQKHMYDEAVAELQKAVQLSGGSPTCIANLARAYVASGKRSEAVKLLSDLKKRSNPSHSHASEIAVIYVSLGDTDQAMNWLEKGYEERFNPASCCGRASILSARTRALKTLCAVLASLVEPDNLIFRIVAFGASLKVVTTLRCLSGSAR